MRNLKRFLIIAVLFVFAIPSARAGDEEAAVRKVIIDTAKALNDFPQTKDIQSVLRFYSDDFTGINDGEWETLDEIKKAFNDIEDVINSGKTVGISYLATNIKIRSAGSFAWATYDFAARVSVDDEALDEELGKCTGVYTKKDSGWYIAHEHCSTVIDHEVEREPALPAPTI